MKSDSELKKRIMNEFKWEAKIGDSEIAVNVKDGHVTLSGEVDAYPKKIEAERAALRVSGVFWVSNHIEVRIRNRKSDEEIRLAALKAIAWNTGIEDNHIVVHVKDGWVTLEGDVSWEYQRTKARNLTEDIAGVVGVINLINVIPVYEHSIKIRKAG